MPELTPEQVKEIIRQELSTFIVSDRFVFSKHIQLFDGKDIQVGKGTGTIIANEGGASGQKLGFFGKTPAVQPAHIADPTAGITVDSEARGAIIAILAALEILGILRSS